MAEKPEARVSISGEVAELRAVIDVGSGESVEMWLGELRQPIIEELRTGFEQDVKRRLGSAFEVGKVDVRESSIEVITVLTVIGVAVITYGGLRQGLDYLRMDYAWRLGRATQMFHPVFSLRSVDATSTLETTPDAPALDPGWSGAVRYLAAANLLMLIALLAILGVLLAKAI